MSHSKHFEKIAWTVTAIMLVLTVLFMNGTALGITASVRAMGYENALFDNSRVHSIDIVIDDWDAFLSTCQSEEYSVCNVLIDGEAVKNVGIRGKGNTSLSSVSSMGSQRYSFKIEFDQYDSSISYRGLDKMSLNNLIQDNTMMKDYLAYTLMAEFGAPAPLCSFAYLTVNGEDWGLYLAVEGVEDSFIERNYGTNAGELYKPDSLSMGGGRGNGRDFDFNDIAEDLGFSFGTETENGTDKSRSATGNKEEDTRSSEGKGDFSSMFGGMEGKGDFSSMFGGMEGKGDYSSTFGDMGGFSNMFGGMGGFGMGSSDVKLQYSDDSYDSYSNIWNNAKTDITDADKDRLIASLKTLAGEDAASVVDVDAVIRYFVVHNYACNGDSYTGSMVHNYYLYEEDGVLSMIPWDYNLAYGTFQGSNAQSTVNTPIDSPVSGGSVSDRPMIGWIFASEEYTELYHSLFKEFIETVDILGIIEKAEAIISPYVEKDPTKFCTYEEYEKGVEALKQYCTLRSESIAKQLESGETAVQQSYADASALNISDMGTMGGMGGFGGNRGDKGGKGTDKNDGGDGENSYSGISDKITEDTQAPSGGTFPSGGSTMPDMGGMFPSGGTMPDMGGMFPSGGTVPDMGGMFPSGGTVPDMGGMFPSGGGSDYGEDGSQQGGMQRPDMGGSQSFPNMGSSNAPAEIGGWLWIAVSVIVLGIGILVAKIYKI